MTRCKQRKELPSEKTCGFSLHYYEDMICVSFTGMPMKIAGEIGSELVSQMICQSYQVDWDVDTQLWMTDVDYGILNGFGTENGLAVMIQDISKEAGYTATCNDNLCNC
jgi:hypothetical protein